MIHCVGLNREPLDITAELLRHNMESVPDSFGRVLAYGWQHN